MNNLNQYKRRAVNDTIIVKSTEAFDMPTDETKGRIIIPDNVQRDEEYYLTYREIISIGELVEDKNIKVGDVVCFNSTRALNNKFNGEEVSIIEQAMVIFILEHSAIIT